METTPSEIHDIVVSLDSETHLIECGRLFPPLVCVSASSNRQTSLVAVADGDRPILALIEAALECRHIVFHNCGFDLGVFCVRFPHLLPKVFKALDEGRIHDTLIREKLLNVTTTGDLEFSEFRGMKKKLGYKLADLVMKYKGTDLSKTKDATDAWRKQYAHLEAIPAAQWPKEAVDYAINDAAETEDIFYLQEDVRQQVIKRIGKDPFITEALHTNKAFCLSLMTAKGMKVNPARVREIEAEVIAARDPSKMKLLLEHGILIPAVPPQPYIKGTLDEFGNPKMKKGVPEKISETALRSYVEALAARNPEVKLVYTDPSEKFPKGQISVAGEFIEEHSHLDPVLEEYEARKELEKLHTTYIPALKYREGAKEGQISELVHGNYDSIKETFRTSSYADKKYPSFNVQNQDPRIRGAVVARPGTVLCSSDYKSLELVTLAQTMLNIFGRSTHADIINSGKDPHEYLGAQIAFLTDENFRLYCNSINAPPTFDGRYEAFKGVKKLGPEAKAFHKHNRTFAKPTGLGYPGGLGADTFVQFAKATYKIIISRPMAAQLKEIWFEVHPDMKEYFSDLKANRKDLVNGPKMVKVKRGDEMVEEQRHVYGYTTPLGAYRANCDYCAAANGQGMQTPAAEGTAIAICRLVRECYIGSLTGRVWPLAFIHDEFITEIDYSNPAQATADAAVVARIMVESMKVVCPGVKVEANPCFMLAWNKDAEPVFDANGVLQVWAPAPKEGV